MSNTSWAETSITWNNKPALGAALASGTLTNKTFAWHEFDVTSYLAAERAAGRNVVALALRAPAAYSLAVNVKSRQASTTKPRLVFTLNAVPTVSLISPTDGASYAAGASITLTATAADGDGTITKVEFFAGANLIGTVTQSPYTFDWTNASSGSHALTAKATDNLGGATTSSTVNITVTAQAALYFIHPNHLNTPRVITNQAQQVVWRWDNDDPFGGNMANENPSGLGNFTSNLRFPGQYFDRETNLHYNYFRDYSPEIGRYVQSDPIGLMGGTNTYAYVEGNPVSKIDPLGLATFMCTKPLHALGGEGARSGLDIWGNPLYHQYLCINDGKGGFTCGGQDQRGQKWYDPINAPGKPSNDKYDPQTCEQKEPDNNCIEQCLLKTFAGPRPRYGIPFGTDCQEWSDEKEKEKKRGQALRFPHE